MKNLELDKTRLTDITFIFGMEEILREIAIIKLAEEELEKEQARIDNNAINNESWGTLEELDEELYCLLIENSIQVTEEYFALGFVEAFWMIGGIAENR